ncbi:MAG: hypothetical protein ABIN61_03315 [candidate division WOR-3 bacterium]
MKFNIRKGLLIFSLILMFGFIGKASAQRTLNITPEGQSIKVDSSLNLTATALWNGNPYANRIVTFSVIQGDGSVSPLVDTTDGAGHAYTVFTAGHTAGINKVYGWYRYRTWGGGWQYVRDTLDIEVVAGDLNGVRITPVDTVVPVTNQVIVVAELVDAYGNHIDATDTTDISFTTSGLGTIGPRSLTPENKIQMVYTTDDLIAVDTITATTKEGGFTDETYITTIGGSPTSAVLSAEDSTVVVSNKTEIEPLRIQLFDQYGNPSAYANYYENLMYEVIFTCSEGAGIVAPDTVNVDPNGIAEVNYLSSTVAGVYTVTGTSGVASDTIHITQIPAPLASVVLSPDSAFIPAGSSITLTAEKLDQYGNHIDAADTTDVLFIKIDGKGTLGARTLSDSNNVKIDYTSCATEADTAHIMAYTGGHADIVVVFNEGPFTLHHFSLSVKPDTLYVSEYAMVEITAKDRYDNTITFYTNPDPVTLSLIGTTAEPSQVSWIILGDTLNELSANIPESSFVAGICTVYVTNKKAEKINGVKALDKESHTGTSSEITWLSSGLDRFLVELLSAKVDTISLNDTTNIRVIALDTFGNITNFGLPIDVRLSASKPGVVFPGGEIQTLLNPVDSFSFIAQIACSELIITVTDTSNSNISGSSNPIVVIDEGSGIGELPLVSNINAKFGSGEILFSLAKEGLVEIKVYNKAGIEVGTLIHRIMKPGYYQTSLKVLNIPTDIYFVLMKGPDIRKEVKTVLIR